MSDTSAQRFALRLRQLRDDRKWTQDDLARRAGISRSYVAKLEGARAEPTLAVIEQLAGALGVTRAELLGDHEARPRPEDRALALLETAAEALTRVPVRYLGRVPAEARGWTTADAEGRTVRVFEEWIGSRDPAALFVVQARGACLAPAGIPDGAFVLCEWLDGRPPRDGWLVVVRIGDAVRLARWQRVVGGVELRDGTGRVVQRIDPGDDAEVLGRAFYAWHRLDEDEDEGWG